FDGDGDVDIDDFNILKGNMGWDGTGGGAPQATASKTPEPATMSLLAIGGLLILRRRRRRA
ncbi:MAG: PEP-CTERM sorting domain-containing protein, partial [Phycisphaerae bacterium]|nr:PEP-CTERM sorting domain-containing protein [Phycisphaerae bacterium]